jgi:hypothetical protein
LPSGSAKATCARSPPDINSSILDPAGHHITDNLVLQRCGHAGPTRRVVACITNHGYRQRDLYQPLSRYWPLQTIELAIFTAAAIALLATTPAPAAASQSRGDRQAASPTGQRHRTILNRQHFDASAEDRRP